MPLEATKNCSDFHVSEYRNPLDQKIATTYNILLSILRLTSKNNMLIMSLVKSRDNENYLNFGKKPWYPFFEKFKPATYEKSNNNSNNNKKQQQKKTMSVFLGVLQKFSGQLVQGYSFNMYAIFSEKLLFLTPW